MNNFFKIIYQENYSKNKIEGTNRFCEIYTKLLYKHAISYLLFCLILQEFAV